MIVGDEHSIIVIEDDNGVFKIKLKLGSPFSICFVTNRKNGLMNCFEYLCHVHQGP